MNKHLEYEGYLGSIEADITEGFLHGRLLFIRDVVTYQGQSVGGLSSAFKSAVDDYLSTCAELGEAPDTPCKGTFNVRIGPALHKRALLAAEREGTSLNDWVKSACAAHLQHDTGSAATERVRYGRTEFRVEAEDEYSASGVIEWQAANHVH